MLFNTLEFGVFLAVVYGLYLLLAHRGQNLLLLAASYVFYGAWDVRFLALIVLSTVIDYRVALAMEASDDERRRKRLVTVSLVSNLGILGVFKYFDFFATSLADLGGLAGFTFEPWLLDVALPVGISFYTFQTLSYTLDVYRRDLRATDRFLDFGLFVAFFPQLVAGPIERASRLLPQVLQPRTTSWRSLGSGCWLMLAGLFKKAVIADNLAFLVDHVYGTPEDATGLEIVVATYAFAWQIYCDFSGYTDVARGVSRIMGFELMLNFNLPYLAVNPSDFWRRWHISLSTWLRDYLYIPLGGNRGPAWFTYRNLALTMLLGGLWHGAAWTYVLWGAYQGLLLCGHRLLSPWLARLAPEGRVLAGAWWLLRVLVMFQLACLGWMIFRADSLDHLGVMLSGLGTLPELFQELGGILPPLTQLASLDGLGDLIKDLGALPGVGRVVRWAIPFAALIGPLFLFQLVQAASRDLQVILRWPLPVRAALYAFLALGLIVLGEDFSAPFIYFQF